MLRAKHKRIIDEFRSLTKKNRPLAALILDLHDFVQAELRKDVIITHLFRTQAEQEGFYGKKTRRKSNHQFWKAVDIRDWIYTAAEKQKIIRFLKQYDSTNRLARLPSGSRSVWLHTIGKGMHFHIQYAGPLHYVFSEGMTIHGRR